MTRLQQIDHFMRIAAELEKSGDLAAYFPERMMARYRDGVARTVIALAEMHRYATILDGVVKSDVPTHPNNKGRRKRSAETSLRLLDAQGVAVGADQVIGKITK